MIYNKIVKEKLNEIKNKKEITILAIESSCDETSCSISINGSNVLSNVISSQIEIHKKKAPVITTGVFLFVYQYFFFVFF